ncbi:HD domain-containing protein [Pseudonocardia sp. NPDC049635]|uniref:HD domain-containing protein n=1 Tax=Pseudonocardia sp. NPDC049635 TaxID=3155506 RepID=UPI0033DB5201
MLFADANKRAKYGLGRFAGEDAAAMPDSDRDLAAFYLARALPQRWRHVQGVARRAERVAEYLCPAEGELLVAAAWLHDIGYAPPLVETGFHPLDGARALRRQLGTGERLWGLVAHHSGAIHEARVLGLDDQLDEFADDYSLVRNLLWYLDMTTSTDGKVVSFTDRMADVRARYSAGHYLNRALGPSMYERQAAVSRAEQWMRHSRIELK